MDNEAEKSVVKAISDLLKCPKCLNIFDQPLLLSCGHRFCKKCIYKPTKNSILKCLTCLKKSTYINCERTAAACNLLLLNDIEASKPGTTKDPFNNRTGNAFDALLPSQNRPKWTTKKTYHRVRKENLGPEGAIKPILPFQDVSTKENIVKWLSNTQNKFDRLTQTQDILDSSDDDDFSLSIPSVSQSKKMVAILRTDSTKGKHVNKTTNKKRRPHSLELKRRLRSHDILKSRSLENSEVRDDNYDIEEFDTGPKVTEEPRAELNEKDFGKNIIQFMEEEFLNSLQTDPVTIPMSPWARMKEMKKTDEKKLKKMKKLKPFVNVENIKNGKMEYTDKENQMEVFNTSKRTYLSKKSTNEVSVQNAHVEIDVNLAKGGEKSTRRQNVEDFQSTSAVKHSELPKRRSSIDQVGEVEENVSSKMQKVNNRAPKGKQSRFVYLIKEKSKELKEVSTDVEEQILSNRNDNKSKDLEAVSDKSRSDLEIIFIEQSKKKIGICQPKKSAKIQKEPSSEDVGKNNIDDFITNSKTSDVTFKDSIVQIRPVKVILENITFAKKILSDLTTKKMENINLKTQEENSLMICESTEGMNIGIQNYDKEFPNCGNADENLDAESIDVGLIIGKQIQEHEIQSNGKNEDVLINENILRHVDDELDEFIQETSTTKKLENVKDQVETDLEAMFASQKTQNNPAETSNDNNKTDVENIPKRDQNASFSKNDSMEIFENEGIILVQENERLHVSKYNETKNYNEADFEELFSMATQKNCDLEIIPNCSKITNTSHEIFSLRTMVLGLKYLKFDDKTKVTAQLDVIEKSLKFLKDKSPTKEFVCKTNYETIAIQTDKTDIHVFVQTDDFKAKTKDAEVQSEPPSKRTKGVQTYHAKLTKGVQTLFSIEPTIKTDTVDFGIQVDIPTSEANHHSFKENSGADIDGLINSIVEKYKNFTASQDVIPNTVDQNESANNSDSRSSKHSISPAKKPPAKVRKLDDSTDSLDHLNHITLDESKSIAKHVEKSPENIDIDNYIDNLIAFSTREDNPPIFSDNIISETSHNRTVIRKTLLTENIAGNLESDNVISETPFCNKSLSTENLNASISGNPNLNVAIIATQNDPIFSIPITQLARRTQISNQIESIGIISQTQVKERPKPIYKPKIKTENRMKPSTNVSPKKVVEKIQDLDLSDSFDNMEYNTADILAGGEISFREEHNKKLEVVRTLNTQQSNIIISVDKSNSVNRKLDFEKENGKKRLRFPEDTDSDDDQPKPKRAINKFVRDDLSIEFSTEAPRMGSEQLPKEMPDMFGNEELDDEFNFEDCIRNLEKKFDNTSEVLPKKLASTSAKSSKTIQDEGLLNIDNMIKESMNMANKEVKATSKNKDIRFSSDSFNYIDEMIKETVNPNTTNASNNLKEALASPKAIDEPCALSKSSRKSKRSILSEILCPSIGAIEEAIVEVPRINVLEEINVQKHIRQNENDDAFNTDESFEENTKLRSLDVDVICETPKKKKSVENSDTSPDVFKLPTLGESLDMCTSPLNNLFLPPPPEFANTEHLEPIQNESQQKNFIIESQKHDNVKTKKDDSFIGTSTQKLKEVPEKSKAMEDHFERILLSPIQLDKNIASTSKNCPLTIIKRDKPKVKPLNLTTHSTPKTRQNSIFSYIKKTQNRTCLNMSSASLFQDTQETPKNNNNEETVLDETVKKVSISSQSIKDNISNETLLGKGSKPIPCVACSRLNKEDVIAVTSLVRKKLITFTNTFSHSVTHLIVASAKDNRVKDHTMKYISAVALGIWVLNSDWIKASIRYNEIVEEDIYEVFDVTGLAGPMESRLYRKIRPLLGKFRILAAPPFKATCKNVVEDVIRDLGGIVVNDAIEFLNGDNGDYVNLIVTEASSTQSFLIDDDWINVYKVATVDIEWLSRSVGQYKTLSFVPFLLCDIEDVQNLNYPSEFLAEIPGFTFSTTQDE